MNKNVNLFKAYKYFAGEQGNPYEGKDAGKYFWWRVEKYAAQRSDDKKENELSETMINYLSEHHWQGDAHSDTTYKEFLKRAKELYLKGLWSRSYICLKAYTLDKL